MNRRPILRTLAGAACVGVLGLSAAGPAAAESVSTPLVIDGVWKAHGTYDDANDRVCVRAYNSVASAHAYAWIFWDNGYTEFVRDAGGDANRTCRTFPGLDARGAANLHVQFVGSNGEGDDIIVRINDL